ncbi:MAG: hypothetical protein OEN50_11630 [Deltaproteobacteria bacterium]|nr:hypothetical protein [Deltaproteobacteria bacterium]
MGMKIKEINSFSFIGNLAGEKKPSEMKEIDEENDIINCKEKFDRKCLLLKPLELLRVSLPGENVDTRQIPVLINDDVRIELMVSSSPQANGEQRPKGQYEVQVQVENKRTTKTPQGDFELDEGDLLVVPPDINSTVSGQGVTSRLIIYTNKPVHVAKGYPVKDHQDKKFIFLQPKKVLDLVEEGRSGGKHFELVENEDIMIEATVRSDSQKIYHKGFGQDEVAFQLSGQRPTRTTQGEFLLETGDMLWIPPGVSHRNLGEMLTMRIVLYTPKPLRLASEYTERAKKVEALRIPKAS